MGALDCKLRRYHQEKTCQRWTVLVLQCLPDNIMQNVIFVCQPKSFFTILLLHLFHGMSSCWHEKQNILCVWESINIERWSIPFKNFYHAIYLLSCYTFSVKLMCIESVYICFDWGAIKTSRVHQLFLISNLKNTGYMSP